MRRSSLSRWGAAAALVAAVPAVAARRTGAAPASEPQPDSGTTVSDVRRDPDAVAEHWCEGAVIFREFGRSGLASWFFVGILSWGSGCV
ncbi:hypothetical protein QFZ49_005210 [Streptomyces turgidiscabies]|uniref:Uncharacterized protein n=1 Tax=Streptomyces turgidiscabies TaxID=85558 RepID=A0ABU0RTB3_9ACTN|nr:hypothetical protein [Streptomyces turgidiscabies]